MRSALAASLAALLFACGGKPPPPTNPPAASLVVAPTDAGAPVAVAPRRLDAALPKDAVWTASIDGRAVGDAFANRDAVAVVKDAGFDLWQFAQIGIDPARPVLIAMIGLTDEQRSALAGSKSTLASPYAATIRFVLPVTDVGHARFALGTIFGTVGFQADGDNAYIVGKSIRVEIASDANTMVVDAALGRDPLASIADLQARIRNAHAEPPARATGEVLRVVYRPSGLAELSAYADLDSMNAVATDPDFDASQRQQFMQLAKENATAIQTLLGTPSKPVVDRVDVIGRRDGGNLVFELRATPGPASLAPPAEQWKPSPSFAPDSTDGFITFARPFASAWKLAGDPPDATLTKSPASRSAIQSGAGLLAALPLGVPLFARLTGHISDFPDTAYARFDRAGEILTANGGRIDVALLAKDVKPADAECILAPKRQCATPLKLGAPAVAMGIRFARLVPVRGTTAPVVAIGASKAALDSLKLHATSAGPFEGSLPQNLGGGIKLPWITVAQHLALDVKLDGNVVSARLTPAP